LKLAELWRVSTVRLLPMYGALFVVWSVLLIAVVQWDTHNYLSSIVDGILSQRAQYLRSLERERLPEAMAAIARLDLQNVMMYGLFDERGRYLSGNIDSIPPDMIADGNVHPIADGVRRVGGGKMARARGLAVRIASGELMVLARSTSVIDRVSSIIRRALLWALSLTLIPGLIGGVWLARRPLRRVRAIEAAVQPVMHGNLHKRLPVSQRGDELDLLAGIVNTMLDEIERLMSEVKGASDSLAHDLRTPLTRVRTQLHGLHRQSVDKMHADTVQQAIEDIDGLLERFRALLRISELEDIHRRAGFADVELSSTLENVRELYEPLAEDRQIRLQVEVASDVPTIHADATLLFEAISNLVDNAIKFAPQGGLVRVQVTAHQDGARIDVCDNGPGIRDVEREAVLQRFYRGSSSTRGASGTGLGLSIVAAIVKLHGFRLEIADCVAGGAQISLLCWRDPTRVER
jgi:signal transduction histidine kinase